MNDDDEDSPFLTVKQAVEILPYKSRKVWQMLSEGVFTRCKGDPRKPQSKTFLLRSEVQAYLAKITKGTHAAI